MFDERGRLVSLDWRPSTVAFLGAALLAAAGCGGAAGGASATPSPSPSPTPTASAASGGQAPGEVSGGRAAGEGSQYFTRCGDSVVSLGQVVEPIIDDIASQGNTSGSGEPGIPYTRNPANELRDCSGNFLRISSALAAACPSHAGDLAIAAGVKPWTPGGDNAFTGEIRARTSRSTARWYRKKGLFTPIFCDGEVTALSADMAANADQIRPGAVIWYAHTGECITRADGIEKLLKRINHVGTVRSVVRDASGTVESYEVYHGRRKGMGSGVDTLVRVYTGLTGGIPPYGNWKEPVVGIAPILPTITPPAPVG